MRSKYPTVEEDNGKEMEQAWDDVSGASLDPSAVRKARAEEIEYVRKMQLYTKVPIEECYRKTGKAPISVRWIDINKGDAANPNYRSRLVARELNTHKRDDLFAGTPPLEALKSILSIATSGNRGEVIMVNDVSRAFFHAKARREVFVQIADEDKLPGDERRCGRLNYSMYGTRDAAQNWANEYAEMLKEIGFEQGLASPCVFYHKLRGIRTFVHGDDYVSTAIPKQLTWLKDQLESKHKIKTQWLGPGKDHQREVKILNRIIGWDNQKGVVYEVDPRHVEIIVDQLKLKEAKAVATPGTKEEGTTTHDCTEALDEQQSSMYRAITARCNYISPDRPDIAYIVKELARKMATPTKGDWIRLKRLGRYLLGRPRLQQVHSWQGTQTIMKAYTDADWAGCRESRRSTTGGCIMLGKHTLKGWSKTQALIALSSGESELYAALKASAEALGMVALMRDFGYELKGEVWGDASAALGIINRKGRGKTRHIQTGLLWIQQTAADQRMRYGKVLGKENPADLYTKYLDVATTNTHVRKLEYGYVDGRSTEAPQLHTLSQSIDEYKNGGGHEPYDWVQILLDSLGEPRRAIQQPQNSGVYKIRFNIDDRTSAGTIRNVGPRVKGVTRQDWHDAWLNIVYDGRITGQQHDRGSSAYTFSEGQNNGSPRNAKWCQVQLISPAKRQSEELYCTEKQSVGIRMNSRGGSPTSKVRKPTESLRGTEQHGVAVKQEVHTPTVNWRQLPFKVKQLLAPLAGRCLQHCHTWQGKFNAMHTNTTSGHEGSELGETTNENVHIKKMAYQQNLSDNNKSCREKFHQALERELNAQHGKATTITTTTTGDAQFCFGNRSNLCSASATNPGLWLRGGARDLNRMYSYYNEQTSRVCAPDQRGVHA